MEARKKEDTPHTKVVNAAKTTLPTRYSLPGQNYMRTESGDQSSKQRSMTEEWLSLYFSWSLSMEVSRWNNQTQNCLQETKLVEVVIMVKTEALEKRSKGVR